MRAPASVALAVHIQAPIADLAPEAQTCKVYQRTIVGVEVASNAKHGPLQVPACTEPTIRYLREVLSAKLKVVIDARWLVEHCRWLKRKQEVIKLTCTSDSIMFSRMAAAAE